MMSFDGKTVLVTGAAGGIGSVTARLFAVHGASLALCDLASPDALADELRAGGTEVTTAGFDVCDRAAAEAFVKAPPRLDAIVANAGICLWDDWNDADWDGAFQRTMDTNLMGVINVMRPAMQRMTAAKYGRAVLLASIAGRMGGLKSSAHYVAAKGGVISLTKWLAQRGAAHGVTVNAVAPGPVETSMIAGQDLDPAHNPMGRFAQPDEIAKPIVFLCSDWASYMTGTTLDINGGQYML